VVAIITAQFAAALRGRAEEAQRRERETRILYDLVRVANQEEATAAQWVLAHGQGLGLHDVSKTSQAIHFCS
jgi:K+-sensing histidine kinase KdpD